MSPLWLLLEEASFLATSCSQQVPASSWDQEASHNEGVSQAANNQKPAHFAEYWDACEAHASEGQDHENSSCCDDWASVFQGHGHSHFGPLTRLPQFITPREQKYVVIECEAQ